MAETLNLSKLAKHFSDEDTAREFLEHLRWKDGVSCPHCSSIGAYKIEAKAGSKSGARKGLWKCATCREQFTVTVGTIFESSRIPLSKWLLAIHLICSSKKGMSAHQLHRMLGITYKSAWFMAHRIRYAMTQEPLFSKLNGTVEVDETYVGGKAKNMHRAEPEDQSVDLTPQASKNVEKLIGSKTTALGVITGRLETLDIHKGYKAKLYHEITNKVVTCEFSEATFHHATNAFGKLVYVTGLLHKNIKGDTIRISNPTVEVIQDKELYDLEPKVLRVPSYADAPSTAEYMRRIRG